VGCFALLEVAPLSPTWLKGFMMYLNFVALSAFFLYPCLDRPSHAHGSHSNTLKRFYGIKLASLRFWESAMNHMTTPRGHKQNQKGV
jgi:hypothetical protein